MKKINFEDNNYFIGEDDSVYMEIETTLEFVDKDNLKRYVIQLNKEEDEELLKKIEEYLK